MGWDSTHKPSHVNTKDFLRKNIEYENEDYVQKVLMDSLVELNEYYAAVERIYKKSGSRVVYCHVTMIQFAPHSEYNFSKKDMDDSCGPVISKCPENVLRLLTPPTNDHSIDWRKRCWDRIKSRFELKLGDRLHFKDAIKFQGGREIHDFVVDRIKPSVVQLTSPSGGYFRLPRGFINERNQSGGLVINQPAQVLTALDESQPEQMSLLSSAPRP